MPYACAAAGTARTEGAQTHPLSWPPLRGGSARRRWGREPRGSPEYFGSRLAKNLIGLLRPYGWFVGNGLDRSVPPCQKYDTAGKPRTVGCADGSRPIPTNIPKPPHKTNGHGRPMVAPTDFVFAQTHPLSWPPLRGGSARRRWGREPRGSPEYFGSRLAKNLIGLLRPYGWFVGNGLDRSVPPCQKYDTAGKQRTVGCADGSRPIPTNIPTPLTRQTGTGDQWSPLHTQQRKNAPPLRPPIKNAAALFCCKTARLRSLF